MLRRALMLCFALLMIFAGPLAAAAQDATPTRATVDGPVGPAVGDAVSWIGPEGTEVGLVSVTEIVDPFDDYQSNSPPQRGFHFVALSITIENTGGRPLTIDPNAFLLVDKDGFSARYGYLYRAPEDVETAPDLQYGELAAGASVSGIVGFQVLNGSEIERVSFLPDSSRLITVVDERAERTPLGSEVTIIGTDGAESSTVVVNDIIDPFDGYASNSPPQRGSHFVVVDVTLTNTGARPIAASPSSFVLVDSQGFIAQQSYVYRADTTVPDFTYTDPVEPGASVSGYIAFQVLNGSEIERVIYSPNYYYDQQIIVAEPGAEGSVARPRPTTVPEPTEVAATAAPSAPAEDCVGLELWFAATVQNVTEYVAIFEPIASALEDDPSFAPAAVREAAEQFQTLADDQAATDPPAAAEELNDFLVTTYQQFADSLTDLADAADADDDAAITAALEAVQAVDATFNGAEADAIVEALAVACPALNDLIGS